MNYSKSIHMNVLLVFLVFSLFAFSISSPVSDQLSTLQSGEELCPVCLDTISDANEVLTPFKCGTIPHKFHMKCIDAWLDHKGDEATCPTCRSPFDFSYQFKVLNDEVSEAIHSALYEGNHVALIGVLRRKTPYPDIIDSLVWKAVIMDKFQTAQKLMVLRTTRPFNNSDYPPSALLQQAAIALMEVSRLPLEFFNFEELASSTICEIAKTAIISQQSRHFNAAIDYLIRHEEILQDGFSRRQLGEVLKYTYDLGEVVQLRKLFYLLTLADQEDVIEVWLKAARKDKDFLRFHILQNVVSHSNLTIPNAEMVLPEILEVCVKERQDKLVISLIKLPQMTLPMVKSRLIKILWKENIERDKHFVFLYVCVASWKFKVDPEDLMKELEAISKKTRPLRYKLYDLKSFFNCSQISCFSGRNSQ